MNRTMSKKTYKNNGFRRLTQISHINLKRKSKKTQQTQQKTKKMLKKI